MGMPQPTALLQERFVVRREDWLTPENPELALQRPLPSEKLSWLVVRPATARKIVVMVTALRIELAMAMALVTALTLVTATALAMVRAARLMVPQSAASQWS
jgi:hypothetical protein